MAEITIYTAPVPSEADWYGWPWEYLGPTPPTPDPTINLLSAVPDGPRDLLLTFDRPPAGDVLLLAAYSVTAVGGVVGYLPAMESVALEGGLYTEVVRLRFVEQFTGGDHYNVAVSGILGPCGEALGTYAAEWVAESLAPQVVSAAAVGYLQAQVRFSAPMTGIGTAGDWTVEPEAGGAAIPVASVAGTAQAPVLTLSAPLDVETEYRVTAPAAARDTTGTLLDAAHDDALFTTAGISGTLTLGASGGTVRIRAIAVFNPDPQRMEV